MKWNKVVDVYPVAPCLAWDYFGKSIGLWNGSRFDSIPEAYSFDDEYAEYAGGVAIVFHTEGERKVCGEISHWMPLPTPPTEGYGSEPINTQQSKPKTNASSIRAGDVRRNNKARFIW